MGTLLIAMGVMLWGMLAMQIVIILLMTFLREWGTVALMVLVTAVEVAAFM